MSQNNQTPSSSVEPIQPLEEPGSTFLGHPKGLFLLFLVEMWERFSYYGMRALLVLYLISVIAVHQLAPGTHTNVIQIDELDQSNQSVASQTRSVQVVVGSSAPTPAPADVTTGTPKLRIVRMAEQPSKDDPTKKTWVADPATTGPFIARGEPGAKGGFSNSKHRIQLINDSEEPVKAEIKILRELPDSRTFFTLNDNSGTVSVTIEPESKRAADKKPFEVNIATNDHDSGRNWLRSDASVLYGWYTGLAYLFPILGGLIADKLIGTHRSMLVGGLLISIGHIILGISGLGDFAQNKTGLSLFMMGLAAIVLGTGHFKPTVSVMVGQLYKPGDPRRDGAFTIFYMGINLGAFLCAFVCGYLGEEVGWHWGFGAAAVGMILGLLMYLAGRPLFLKGIGEAPKSNANSASLMFLVASLALSAAFGLLYHNGAMAALQSGMSSLQSNKALSLGLISVLALALAAWVLWFLSINRREDRGPIITIFVFMIFNAFFWIAFEQAGSSINVFTEQNTDRMIGTFEVPATWFQSINAGAIFVFAPIFALIWSGLGKRKMNPSQPAKIALGLIFLGIGYIFMVMAGQTAVGGAAKASMWLVFLTYVWHTLGELCLSPTGLSYVTKAAPVKFVSLLMGIWFISSFIANLGGGLVASLVEDIESGKIKLPWNFGGQADFFFLFVVTSIGAGVVVLALTPLLKRLMRNPND
jgi:POT family proton-dependent oligopeptide transporter